MEEIFNLSVRNLLILVLAILILTLILFAVFKAKNNVLRAILGVLVLGGILYCIKIFGNYKPVLMYWVAPSFVLALLGALLTMDKKRDELWDVKIETEQGDQYIENVKRGVVVAGAAGTAKTEGILYKIMVHFAGKVFSGIIYDFKKGELTEMAIPLFKERLKIISCSDPQGTVQINPIHPDYINGEKDINQIVSVIVDNLIDNGVGKGNDFFKDAASSLFSAVILKFWIYYPEICTLPHVMSFIIASDFGEMSEDNLGQESFEQFAKLKKFLTDDQRVAIQASPFLLGLASARQTASVISTLANGLRKICYPELFWTLSGHQIDLNINDKENNIVVSVLNEPDSTEFLSPINATIIHVISKQMMKRNRNPSFILLDEAPTIRLLNMAQLPATMRSFGVAVVYCVQDFVQGYVKYGREGFQEIIANLSTQIFGKTNFPETAKFYETFFELVKEKTKSISRKGDFGSGFGIGDRNVTIGEREVAKHRAHEFTKLKTGEFAFISDGESKIVKVKRSDIKREEMPVKEEITETLVYSNFKKILHEAQSVLD